jgi:hypothetical protein
LDNEVTAKFTTGTHLTPEAGRVTVDAVYKSWSTSQGHISAKTAATRRSAWGGRVEPQWGHVAVVDVKTSAIKAWVASMVTDEVGAATIENAFGPLRQIMGAALEDNRIARNPRGGVPLPRRQHADCGYLTHAQVSALAAAVDRRAEVVLLAFDGGFATATLFAATHPSPSSPATRQRWPTIGCSPQSFSPTS